VLIEHLSPNLETCLGASIVIARAGRQKQPSYTTYIHTYIHTYLLHGAESFLRS